jgi:hypothetical protein
MIASHHIHPYRQFDDFNPGVGFECSVTPQWAATLGYFRNSLDRPSFYAGALYTPQFAHRARDRADRDRPIRTIRLERHPGPADPG